MARWDGLEDHIIRKPEGLTGLVSPEPHKGRCLPGGNDFSGKSGGSVVGMGMGDKGDALGPSGVQAHGMPAQVNLYPVPH